MQPEFEPPLDFYQRVLCDEPGPNYLKKLTSKIKDGAPETKGGFCLFDILWQPSA